MTLEEMQKLCDQATPGPWGYTFYDGNDNRSRNVGQVLPDEDHYGDDVIKRDSGVYPPEDYDADFIIAARTYLPKLLAVARAAQVVRENFDIHEEDLGLRGGPVEGLLEALAALEAST